MDVDIRDFDSGFVLQSGIVGMFRDREELSNLVGSLGSESVVFFDISKSSDLFLTSG